MAITQVLLKALLALHRQPAGLLYGIQIHCKGEPNELQKPLWLFSLSYQGACSSLHIPHSALIPLCHLHFPGVMGRHQVACDTESATGTHCCLWLGIKANTPLLLQRTFRFTEKAWLTLTACTATWRLQKPVGKDAMRSGLQWRKHRVELLPSAAARPDRGR